MNEDQDSSKRAHLTDEQPRLGADQPQMAGRDLQRVIFSNALRKTALGLAGGIGLGLVMTRCMSLSGI